MVDMDGLSLCMCRVILEETNGSAICVLNAFTWGINAVCPTFNIDL